MPPPLGRGAGRGAGRPPPPPPPPRGPTPTPGPAQTSAAINPNITMRGRMMGLRKGREMGRDAASRLRLADVLRVRIGQRLAPPLPVSHLQDERLVVHELEDVRR